MDLNQRFDDLLNVKFVSHNVLRINCNTWGDGLLRDLTRSTRDLLKSNEPIVLALQEVLSWKSKSIGGFRIWTDTSCDCAILVPSNFAHFVRSTFFGDRYFGVVLGRFVVVSVHLIRDGRIAENTLVDISWEFNAVQSRFRNETFALLIGIDANV